MVMVLLVIPFNNRGFAMATSIKIDNGLKIRIQNLAAQKNRSPHWLMRQAITEYVDREEARESFKQEAMDSWKCYQKTGKHLSHQEVQDWLKSWGTPHEKELPECHE
jgi:predicted transcriptional regulator